MNFVFDRNSALTLPYHFGQQNSEVQTSGSPTIRPERVHERVGLVSTEIWAGLGEYLSAIETKLCAPCNGRNQMQEFAHYLADASSSDKTPLRYNVSNFLNSATTRTFPLGSASP